MSNEPTTGAIEAGTLVRVRTTNGGEMTGLVESRYIPSYDLDLVEAYRPISSWRIRSVVILRTVEDLAR